MSLNAIQQRLERIYDVRSGHDVNDFLVTDPDLVAALEPEEAARDVKEKLLVRQEGENVDVALYLDAGVVDQLAEASSLETLPEDHLAEFWVALEGVSHFLYLTWRAHWDHSVTLLELEMQAEVDKFVTTLLTLGPGPLEEMPVTLHRLLFEDVDFDEALDADGLERYREANRFAGKYCRQLRHRYLADHRLAALLHELRRFYRMPQTGKIQHIETC